MTDNMAVFSCLRRCTTRDNIGPDVTDMPSRICKGSCVKLCELSVTRKTKEVEGMTELRAQGLPPDFGAGQSQWCTNICNKQLPAKAARLVHLQAPAQPCTACYAASSPVISAKFIGAHPHCLWASPDRHSVYSIECCTNILRLAYTLGAWTPCHQRHRKPWISAPLMTAATAILKK